MTKQWKTEQTNEGKIITTLHIHPLDDWQQHVLLPSCNCEPKKTTVSYTDIYVHNAYDGREYFETFPLPEVKHGRTQ